MEIRTIKKALLLSLMVAGIFSGIAAPALALEASHPFTAGDLVTFQRVGAPSPSPEGSWIVFPLRSTDLAENRGQTNLWIIRPDGTGLRQLTFPPGNDFEPCWSPDGSTVYYLSTRSGSSQVWKISREGGDAGQVTDLPLDLSALKISPDGKSLAFTMEVFPGTGYNATATQLKSIESQNASGRVYDTLPVRHWDTYEDGRRNHIFVMPLSTGRPVDVMQAMDADSPSVPFGGSEEYAFTPDNAGIVFSAADTGRVEMWSTEHSLYYAPVSGTGPVVNLTPSNRAWITQPVFSPDGSSLAYLAMTRPGYESDRYRIMIRSWPDGTAREVAASWDHSPSSIIWSEDGKFLYVTAMDQGNSALFAIDPVTGDVRTLVGKGSVSSVSTVGNRLVYGYANMTAPADLFTIDPDGTHAVQITQVNSERLATVRMGEYEQFSFVGWNNETVYGYVVKPVDFDPAKKYPVAFLIHGGPQGSFPDDFSYRWNPQVYAGRGYAVVMIDFHGSVGYGQAFTDSIRDDYGGKPLEDLQKGLNATLETNTWMDKTKVSALGASYGGYMINWIEGAWPDRFVCLVSHDGMFDTRQSYYDTDELWFEEWDNNGTPWVNPEAYARYNPADHVAAWKTPMLVIQGGKDYRVPETQGFAAFTALQRRNIQSRLLYFPEENHWVLKPQNSILWHHTVLDWLDQWSGNTVASGNGTSVTVGAVPAQAGFPEMLPTVTGSRFPVLV
ncbi:S9 family peptidase [Methanoregula sp.]|uniref:alpha/beta hydrolase family protein n=1 Tax=Methanoregula sp. TaxID=2052170 RepID=UPI0023744414|nr:S9 family peptidase [Methanoregula sp.]MDD1687272.1 S9 family peptidase [Methanoregula sp.]